MFCFVLNCGRTCFLQLDFSTFILNNTSYSEVIEKAKKKRLFINKSISTFKQVLTEVNLKERNRIVIKDFTEKVLEIVFSIYRGVCQMILILSDLPFLQFKVKIYLT